MIFLITYRTIHQIIIITIIVLDDGLLLYTFPLRIKRVYLQTFVTV